MVMSHWSREWGSKLGEREDGSRNGCGMGSKLPLVELMVEYDLWLVEKRRRVFKTRRCIDEGTRCAKLRTCRKSANILFAKLEIILFSNDLEEV